MTSFSNRTAATATGILLMLAAVAVSCKHASKGSDVVASVGSATLTDDDILAVIPSGLSTQEDTTAFINAYVDQWISDQLVNEVAARNITNLSEINKMAEDYRRQLIMWEYRKLKVAEDSSLQITKEQIEKYYAENGSEMKLDDAMVRGVYIKIPSNAKRLPDVRNWYKSSSPADIDKMEKVGMSQAIHYDYFRDQWIPWKQIINKIPTSINDEELHKGFSLDFQDGDMTYLLYVSDVLPAGTKMPLSAAEPMIRERLQSLNRVRTDEKLRESLRKSAEESGKLYRR